MLDLAGVGGLALCVTISPPRRDPIDDLQLDGIVARSWSGVEPEPLGPWLLRAAAGFGRRANAVAVLGATPAAQRSALIEQAEAFYDARRLPTTFEIVDTRTDIELVDALVARGYVDIGSGTTTSISPLRTLRSIAPPQRDGRVVISDAPSQDWIDLWWSTLDEPDDRGRAAASDLLWDLQGRLGFAAHVADGQLAATGLAVIDGSWLGMYCVGTRPDRRGRGSARRVIGALATWGTANAAKQAYVALPDDGPLRQLFDGLGFTPAYRSRFLRQAI